MMNWFGKLSVLGCLFLALTSVSVAMEENMSESSALSGRVLSANDFWDPENQRFRLSPDVPVRIQAVDFINRNDLVTKLKEYFSTRTYLTSEDLNIISHQVLSDTAWEGITWLPFLGLNFCAISLLTLTYHSGAAWLFPGLEDGLLLADIIIIVRHYTCKYANTLSNSRRDL